MISGPSFVCSVFDFDISAAFTPALAEFGGLAQVEEFGQPGAGAVDATLIVPTATPQITAASS